MILYGYAVLCMVSIGRSGQIQYVVPRYVTFILFAIVGMLLIIIHEIYLNWNYFTQTIRQGFSLLILAVSIALLIQNIYNLPIQLSSSWNSVQIMLRYHETFATESLSLLTPGWSVRSEINKSIGILEENHLNVFYGESKATDVRSTTYSIDSVFMDKSKVTLSGRIWDDIYQDYNRVVSIEIRGINYLAPSIAGSMNAASQILNKDQDELSFSVQIPYEEFKEGANDLSLDVFTLSEGMVYRIPFKIWIEGDKTEIIKSDIFSQPVEISQGYKKNEESKYNIDSMNLQVAEDNKIHANNQDMLLISGWCIDEKNKFSAGDIYLKVGETWIKAEKQERLDVADYFHSIKYKDSGFTISIPLEKYKEGNYSCSIILINENKKSYCENVLPWEIDIANN